MKSTASTPLACSEEILQEIFRHTPIGVVLTDLHGTVFEVNEALCAMIGYPRDQVVGRMATSFLHADAVPAASDLLSRFRDGDEGSRRVVCPLQSRSGRPVWTNITVSVVRSQGDEPICGIAFIEDIGERLETDRELHKTAALYRQVVQDQTEMIVRWLPDGTRTFVNQAYARYFGLSEDELIGTSFMPLVVNEDRPAIENEIRALTPLSPVRTGIHRVILADGSIRWNEWTDRATFDETGKILMLQSVGRDVTDRIEAGEALRNSESRYRQLFENLPIAAWEVDWSSAVAYLRSLGLRSTGDFQAYWTEHSEVLAEAVQRVRVCEVNSAALALIGVPDRQSFESWLAARLPLSPEAIIRGVGPVVFGGAATHRAELQLQVVSGETRDVLFQWARNPSSSNWRVITIVLDLTEQKEAEEALRRSGQLYRDLFHNLPVAVWETDWNDTLDALQSEGITTPEKFVELMKTDLERLKPPLARRRIVEANQKALDLLGVSDIPSLERATWPPKVAPDHRNPFTSIVANLLYGRTRKAIFELQIERSDGSIVDVEALMSTSEAAPGRIISTAIDVTARKNIERDLLHSQALLERAQAIAQLGSWEMNLDTDEVYGSREYWRINDGVDSGPGVRKLSEVMVQVHPEDRDRVWKSIVDARDAFLSGSAREEAFVEYRIVRPDGAIRIMRGQGVFTRTPSGEVRGYGIKQDITEIKKAEEAAKHQREELMRADRMISLGILVSGVAHEINNPNQFIMLNAPFLQNAWKDVAPVVDQFAGGHPEFRVSGLPWSEMRREIPEIFGEIDRGAERIRSIVSELRGFARDHDPVDLRPCSLNEVLEGSLRMLSSHIRRATANFSTDLASDLPMIVASPQRLEQVIVNLVLNSCQALADPLAAIRVATSSDPSRRFVLLKVIDEGRGISAENLKKIRDPFFTTKRAEGGMGLGLSVSERIVQEHNGVLSFESEPGLGTTAILSLPAVIDR